MEQHKKELRTLLIISHVVHYGYEAKIYAYGPYAREIEIWADMFRRVIIASPLRDEKPPEDCIPFKSKNIEVVAQLERGGNTFFEKIQLILSMPAIVFNLSKAIAHADAVHVRCPGNLGLLGALITPVFGKYRIAKYAGQWNGYPGEDWSVRFQRQLLKSKWWNAPVTVYGKWENQPAHIIPFFTSILTDEQIARARDSIQGKKMHAPIRILYAGRLSRAKNVHILLESLQELAQRNIRFVCKIAGTGEEYSSLTEIAKECGMDSKVEFLGAVQFEEMLPLYQWADVLTLASETEGWPKAITEAMAFGVVCIGSNRGLVPQILSENRGLIVEPGNKGELVETLLRVVRSPDLFEEISIRASSWSRQYTLNGLQTSLRSLMITAWNLPPNALASRIQLN